MCMSYAERAEKLGSSQQEFLGTGKQPGSELGEVVRNWDVARKDVRSFDNCGSSSLHKFENIYARILNVILNCNLVCQHNPASFQ